MADWYIVQKFFKDSYRFDEKYPNGMYKNMAMFNRPLGNILEDCRLQTDFGLLKAQLFKRKTTRRVNTWLFAELTDDNKIELKRYDTPFAILHEDVPTTHMIIEFVATPSDVTHHSQGLVSALMRWLPFSFQRYSMGVYKVDHTYPLSIRVKKEMDRMMKLSKEELMKLNNEREYGLTAWCVWERIQRKSSPTYFQGIKFDVQTGKCLNARNEEKSVEIPERRKAWRRNLAKYKKGIKTRLKVGGLDKYINTISQLDWEKRRIELSDSSWVKLLATCLDKQEFPKEILLGFATFIGEDRSRYGATGKLDWDYKVIDNQFKMVSRYLRIELKVFGDTYKHHSTYTPKSTCHLTPKELVNNYEEANK